MFDDCYFDYYGKTRKIANEPKVVSEIELWIDDNCEPKRNIGTVFSEERTWNHFLVSEYKSSDGITVKNEELPDGRRVSESYDSVMGQYECNVFDNQGTLSTESGTSVFIRCINGKMI